MTSETDVSRSIEELKHANWNPNRVKAADKLGEMGDAMAVEPLIESLQDESPGVAEAAARALVKIGDVQGVEAVLKRGSSLSAAMAAAKVLAGLGPLGGGIRRAAVKDLKDTVAAELVEPLIQALRDGRVEVRAMAALALGGVEDDSRVVEALRQALDDEDVVWASTTGVAIPLLGYPQTGYSVAEVAGLSLVKLGDKESTKRIVQLALEKWYRGDENPKEDFVRFMFMLGWESVIAELALMCEHKARFIREKAVSCLAAIGDAQVIEPLIDLLNHEDTNVRKKAVQALGEIGDSSALEALTQVAQDKKRAVRGAAKKSMKQIEARSS